MGRIPVGSLGSKDSMSACRGKGAAKQGTPPPNREKAMVESAAPEKLSAKGAFREPPVERFTTSTTAKNRRSSSRTAIKSAVVGSARATPASEGTQMSPKFELGLRKEVERGTAHGKCARQKGRNAQGEAAKRRSETSEAEDTIVEKRVVDDVKLRKPARPHDGISRDVTRVACPSRRAFAAEMGLGEWSTPAKLSFSANEEPKRGTMNDALRSHSLNSSCGSDSSSSFSTFESSSFSCKSEPATAFAKGYSSPATELKPPELFEVLVACVSPELETESARKWNDASKLPSEGSNCELSKAVHSNMHRRELVEEEFLMILAVLQLEVVSLHQWSLPFSYSK